ncbi:MAG: DUF3592 domain-containing protein [Phycisphaerales bacterium JB050]
MIRRFGQFLYLALLVVFGRPGYERAQQFLKENPHEAKLRPRVVIGGCLLFLGLFTIVSTIAWNFEHFRTAFWPTTTGVVQSSEVRRSRSYRIEANVRVEYAVDGVTYSTTRIKLEPTYYRDIRYAIEDTDRYPVGAAVTVSYDPKKPQFGILEPGYELMSNWFFLCGLCLSILGIGFFCMQLARSVSLRTPEDPFKSPERVS